MRKYILLIREIILFTNSFQFNLIVFFFSLKNIVTSSVLSRSHWRVEQSLLFWRVLHYLFTPLQPQQKILNNVKKMQSCVGCFAKYNWNFHLMLPFATLLEIALTERYVSEYSFFLFWKKWIKTLIICDEAQKRYEWNSLIEDMIMQKFQIEFVKSLFLQKICV